MKKHFDFGEIDYYGKGKRRNAVTVDIEYKEKGGGKKEFTASAEIWNNTHNDIICGGQCLDTVAQYINDPVFKEIYRLWKLYHLNGMHPECIHQALAGWNEKALQEVTLYHWHMTREARDEQKAAENAAISALKEGRTFIPTEQQSFISRLPYSLTTHTDTLPADKAKYYEPKKPLYKGDLGHTEKKLLGWLRETEHPDGILGKPCPECGYKYGTSWMYFPIPEEDEKSIYGLF